MELEEALFLRLLSRFPRHFSSFLLRFSILVTVVRRDLFNHRWWRWFDDQPVAERTISYDLPRGLLGAEDGEEGVGHALSGLVLSEQELDD